MIDSSQTLTESRSDDDVVFGAPTFYVDDVQAYVK